MDTSTPLDHLQGIEVGIHLRKRVELKNALSWSPLAAGEWLTSRGLSLQAVGPATAIHHWPRIVGSSQPINSDNR
jgi:hypothetical protein